VFIKELLSTCVPIPRVRMDKRVSSAFLKQSVAHKVLRNEQRNDANHRRSPVQHFTVRLEDGKLSALVKVVLRKLRRDGAQSRDGDDKRHQREVLRVDDVRRDARNHLRREEQLEGFFLRDNFASDGGDEANHSRAAVDELRRFPVVVVVHIQ